MAFSQVGNKKKTLAMRSQEDKDVPKNKPQAAPQDKVRGEEARIAKAWRAAWLFSFNSMLNFLRQWFSREPVKDRNAARQERFKAVLQREIDEHQKSEAALQLERHLFGTLMDNLPDRIYFKDTNSRFLRNNKAHLARFGLKSAEEAQGKSDFDFFTEEHARQAFEDEQRVIQTGQPITIEEKETWPDGRITWALSTKMPLRDETGKIVGTFGTSRDITRRKRMEQELHRIKDELELRVRERTEELEAANKALQIQINESEQAHQMLETSLKEVSDLKLALDEHAIVAITDPWGKITYVNDKFCTIAKYSREELLGQDHRRVNSGHHPKEFIRDLWTTIGKGQVWKGEMKNRAKDGACYWVDTTIVPFLDAEGRPRQYVAISADITERKTAEAALMESLHEKETLLKEIHHRVKNNMQLISSLLEMQAKYIQDKAALTAFQDCKTRIRSMAMIHEKLYQSPSLAKIDFGDYARGLVNMLIRTYRTAVPVKVELQLDDLSLNLETAIPLGLILNELITNSLEHAFPNQQAGTIWVSLQRSGEYQTNLTVRDNGVGLPPEFAQGKPTTLGLRLIHIWSEQLNAQVDVHNDPGAMFTVFFQQMQTKPRIGAYERHETTFHRRG